MVLLSNRKTNKQCKKTEKEFTEFILNISFQKQKHNTGTIERTLLVIILNYTNGILLITYLSYTVHQHKNKNKNQNKEKRNGQTEMVKNFL